MLTLSNSWFKNKACLVDEEWLHHPWLTQEPVGRRSSKSAEGVRAERFAAQGLAENWLTTCG